MAAGRWLISVAVACGLVEAAAAQFRTLPPSPPVSPYVGGRRPRVVVSSFYPNGFSTNGFYANGWYGPPPGVVLVPVGYATFGYAPFGLFEPCVRIQVVAPVAARRLLPLDLSGVDLDLGPPPWAQDEKPRIGVPPVVQAPPPADKLPPPAKVVEPPKKAEPPPEPPKPPDPVPAKASAEEGKRLLTLGVAAFGEQAYGLAAQRLQQAIDADPAAARPHFLLGQAYLALGKFREAVQSIGLGLAKDPAWPHAKFNPRLELYQNQPADWARQIALLEETQERHPLNAGYLFLLAYVRWFDGDRDAALRLFREVRPLVGDPALVDLFLKAAP